MSTWNLAPYHKRSYSHRYHQNSPNGCRIFSQYPHIHHLLCIWTICILTQSNVNMCPRPKCQKEQTNNLWINSASQHTQSLRILNASNVKHWILFEIKKKHCTKNGFVNVRSAFFSFIFDWLQTITIRIRATRQTNLIGCAFANGIIFINFIFAIWWAIAYSGARQTLVRDIITCEFIVITQRILDVFR